MPQKKSDGRGWFFESTRHSLAAKGIKTGQKERRPIVGRYARPWSKRDPTKPLGGKPLLEQVETDPSKRWLWGIKRKPAEQRRIIAEAVREPKQEEEKRLHITLKQEKEEPKEQKPAGINPQALEGKARMQAVPPPDKSVMKQKSKSRKAKYASVEEAWEAAQDELAARYGDSGSSSGVVKDEAEMEQRLAKNMGVH